MGLFDYGQYELDQLNNPNASNAYGYGTISNGINNNINNSEYGSIGNVANDSITGNLGTDYGVFGNEANNQITNDTGSSGYDWKALGASLLKGSNQSGNTQLQQKTYRFTPQMAQPNYINTQTNTTPSNSTILTKNNLYNYLTR
jgi:hypothetical protein